MQKYLDRDNDRIETERSLAAELDEMKKSDPINYDFSLDDYIKNRIKAGTLAEVRMTLCPHCLAAIRSRGEKINGILIYPEDYADEADEIDDESEAQSYCDWCEEAGHLEIYAIV